MSDRRVKYIILASVIFVGIVGISQGQGLFELNDVNIVTPASSLSYAGHVTVFLKDPNGNIQAYYQTDNIVMDSGTNCSMDLIFDTSFNPQTCDIVKYIAIGGSSTALDPKQTNLIDKTTNGNQLATLTAVFSAEDPAPPPPSVSADKAVDLTLFHTFTILPADGGMAIGEAGLFDGSNTSPGGVLDASSTSTANIFARTLIGPFSMVSTGSLVEIIWTVHLN